jgi:hypothetical protein
VQHHICLLLGACASITKLTIQMHAFAHMGVVPQAVREAIMASVVVKGAAPRNIDFALIE